MIPSKAQILELRRLFFEKLEKDSSQLSDGYHTADIDRIKYEDIYLQRFLEFNDLDYKASLNQLWDVVEWRKKFGTNDITEDNCNVEYLREGGMFPRKYDLDGKLILIIKCSDYIKGTKKLDDMKRNLIYWIERIMRQENWDQLTLFFDMRDTGFQNIDMEYTKYIINSFKFYYPNSLNYIIIYEMPWLLSATFKIIKQLLPSKAVEKLKFLTAKTIREYIDEDNLLKTMGGNDDYQFEFIPEVRNKNNNIPEPSTPNSKRVHFANLSPPESPMDKSPTSFPEKEGDMLKITPPDAINFTKSGNELVGTFEISNIDEKPITYKIKTTSPEKFRVRPSTGVLAPGANSKINVVLQQGHQMLTLNRDKFLVMCTSLPDEAHTNSNDIADLWKNMPSNCLLVESHRLKCTLPINASGDGYKNGHLDNSIDSERHMTNIVASSISQLTLTTQRLEAQLKVNQTLQWITIFVFLFLSMAIVYILKMEINNSSTSSKVCMKNDY